MSITGCGVSGSISKEAASFNPRTFLPNSTTAHCIPKQIPKNGILFSLTNLIALILPSIPLSPKPGATSTPFNFCNVLAIVSSFNDSDEIHLRFTLHSFIAPA